MKGFYTLLAAAAVTFSASAVDLNVKNLQLRSTEGLRKEVVKTNNTLTVSEKAGKVEKSTRVLAARKADTTASIEGEWEITFGDYYFQSSINSSFVANYYLTLEDGIVYFESEEENPFFAEFDEATGLLTFNKEYIGTASGYYVFQDPFVYSYVINDWDHQTITAQYDATAGTITFGKDNGIAWNGYTDTTGTNFGAYFGGYDLEGAVKASWELLDANATFLENILYNAFSGAINSGENTTPVSVEVYGNASTPGIYRVNDAFKATYQNLGYGAYVSPSMTIDATDPNDVVIGLTDTGIGASETSNWVVMSIGFGNPSLQTPENTITLTKADGYATITFPYHSMGMTPDMSALYYISNYVSTLKFKLAESGVANVATDNANAPVEYFNLQGVRVANPEAGQLVIRRQGTTVEKVVLR